MPKERSFYFMPLKVVKGRKPNSFEPFVRLGRTGTMNFGKETLENLKIELGKKVFVRLFADIPHRALGFQFSSMGGTKENGYRIFEPKKTIARASEVWRAQIGIGSFLRELQNVVLPSGRLYINEYSDTETMLKYYYIKIPYGKAE